MSKANAKVLKELRERFVDGEKLTLKEIVDEYFNPKTPYAYLVALKSARGFIQNLKNWFRNREGIWLGCLDENRHFGVISTEAEVKYALTSYYKFVKGAVYNASVLAKNAKEANLLPDGMITGRLLIAKPEMEIKGEEVPTRKKKK